jgi:hypothetical protein
MKPFYCAVTAPVRESKPVWGLTKSIHCARSLSEAPCLRTCNMILSLITKWGVPIEVLKASVLHVGLQHTYLPANLHAGMLRVGSKPSTAVLVRPSFNHTNHTL